MKKVSVLLTGLFLAAGVVAFGQTPAKTVANPNSPLKATPHQELKRDIKKDKGEIKKDRVDRKADIKAGDKAAAVKETKEIKAEKADIRQDKKDLKAMKAAKK